MRNDALIRVLRLAERLRGSRATLDALADEFKVCTRTVRRDLEALSVAGVPVRSTSDNYAVGLPTYYWVER